jgi:DnaJ-class molecular chaperone
MKIKCNLCDGKGKYDYGMVWDHDDPGYTTCHRCKGTGFIKKMKIIEK